MPLPVLAAGGAVATLGPLLVPAALSAGSALVSSLTPDKKTKKILGYVAIGSIAYGGVSYLLRQQAIAKMNRENPQLAADVFAANSAMGVTAFGFNLGFGTNLDAVKKVINETKNIDQFFEGYRTQFKTEFMADVTKNFSSAEAAEIGRLIELRRKGGKEGEFNKLDTSIIGKVVVTKRPAYAYKTPESGYLSFNTLSAKQIPIYTLLGHTDGTQLLGADGVEYVKVTTRAMNNKELYPPNTTFFVRKSDVAFQTGSQFNANFKAGHVKLLPSASYITDSLFGIGSNQPCTC